MPSLRHHGVGQRVRAAVAGAGHDVERLADRRIAAGASTVSLTEGVGAQIWTGSAATADAEKSGASASGRSAERESGTLPG